MKGFLIVVEGPEGSGKSTLAQSVADTIGAKLFRQPGGTPVAEKIRSIFKDHHEEHITTFSELMLVMSSRAQLFHNEVLPLLKAGETVILDRHEASTYVYQHDIIEGPGRSEEFISLLNSYACEHREPDITLYLKVDAATSKSRMIKRDGATRDRMESKVDLSKLILAYDKRLANIGQHSIVRTIDASRPECEVLECALDEILMVATSERITN